MNSSSENSGGGDWRINEVVTDLVVTEQVGQLSPEEVRKLVRIVLEHLRDEQHRTAQRQRDTEVNNRAYQSDVVD